MLPSKEGSVRLFRFAGIDVHIHWSWFVLAWLVVQTRLGYYASEFWNFAEYLGLFAIVLLHEFGHSLACRQVGGRADTIVLWPFGGVAYVSPPPRPAPVLWSIAGGPLVNVILAALSYVLFTFVVPALSSPEHSGSDALRCLEFLAVINVGLLVFNMLPIYPLDGGQLLQSLLWFKLGQARSLYVATVIGFLGTALLIGAAIWLQSLWLVVLVGFIFLNCARGFARARAMLNRNAVLNSFPQRARFTCPSCHLHPPAAPIWNCGQCQLPFDPFEHSGTCPSCHTNREDAQCFHCGAVHAIRLWQPSS